MNAVLDYKRKIHAIQDLPTLPVIAQRVLAVANDEDEGPEKLSTIIATDQSLSVKVLRLANSAYYGYRGKVSTIRRAVALIGLNMMKQLSLSVLVTGSFGRGGKARADFWKHSFWAGTAGAMLGKHVGIRDNDVCFMAGLLHDVGKLIIETYFPDETDLDHTEVGAWMAERWQLPQQLINAIALHHATDIELLTEPVVACTHAANVCSKLALADKETTEEIHPNVLAAIGMTETDMRKIVIELRSGNSKINELFK